MKLTESDFLDLLRTNDATRVSVARLLAIMTAESNTPAVDEKTAVAEYVDNWE